MREKDEAKNQSDGESCRGRKATSTEARTRRLEETFHKYHKAIRVRRMRFGESSCAWARPMGRFGRIPPAHLGTAYSKARCYSLPQ